MPEVLHPRDAVSPVPLTAHGVTLRAGAMRESVSLAAFRGQADTLRAFVGKEFDVDLPDTSRSVENADGITFIWAGPDQWLLRAAPGTDLLTRLSPCAAFAALTAQGDSRTALELRGPGARAIAAKLVPVDLHPRAFAAGDVALTLAGHIAVILRQVDDTPCYEFLVFRSLAQSLHHELHTAMLGGIPQADRIS